MKLIFCLLKEIGHWIVQEFIPKVDHGEEEFALFRVPYEQRLLGSSNAIYAYPRKGK